MHIRVLLSRYRSYTPCPVCDGARLKPDALLWRVGGRDEANAALASARQVSSATQPAAATWSEAQLARCPACRCTI